MRQERTVKKVEGQKAKQRNKYLFGGNRQLVLERDNYKCVKCGMTDKEHRKHWKRSITVDHIDGNGKSKPKKFKNNSLKNLQTLCLICHGTKDYQIYRKMRQKDFKVADKDVRWIRNVGFKYLSPGEMAKRFKVSTGYIYYILKHYRRDSIGDRA